MNVTVERSIACGVTEVPPSKSMAHRALICGALSGHSTIYNVAESKDMFATAGCLSALGADIKNENGVIRTGGLDPFNPPKSASLFCNESGSTLRFFIPLCLMSDTEITLTGSERLFERPLDIYEDICRKQGLKFSKNHNSLTICGKLNSGHYEVPGDVSSQFISGLLFALPLLQGNSSVAVTGRFESESYINLTLSALKSFGIDITRSENTFYIPGSQRCKSTDFTVEGDCSNAAFLDGFNLLGGNVEVTGLNPDTLQGDMVYKTMFRDLQNGVKEFDLSDCPDLGPVMFALAAALGGATFTGTKRLRIKESDRVQAMADELEKFGISCNIKENSVTVNKGTLKKPEVVLCGHNDHRIVMALTLLCTLVGGSIQGAQAVSKSFPDFFEKIKKLQIGITEHDS